MAADAIAKLPDHIGGFGRCPGVLHVFPQFVHQAIEAPWLSRLRTPRPPSASKRSMRSSMGGHRKAPVRRRHTGANETGSPRCPCRIHRGTRGYGDSSPIGVGGGLRDAFPQFSIFARLGIEKPRCAARTRSVRPCSPSRNAHRGAFAPRLAGPARAAKLPMPTASP